MTQTAEIAAHLPLLRRFARLLIGDQRSGDVLVLATLQHLAMDPVEIRGGIDLRLGLYRALIRLWLSPTGAHLLNLSQSLVESDGAGNPDKTRLHQLSRAAFLLINLDEFSRVAVMGILELTWDSLDTVLDIANTDLNRLLATDVMIIEDEPLIALEIESIVQALGHTVTSVVRTASQAISAAAKRPPQLILSDIQLADGSSGIDAVAEIVRSNPIPVVFITAFPEKLLTGLRSEPTYLISKPFKPRQVKAVVCQALYTAAKGQMNLDNHQMTQAVIRRWSGESEWAHK